MKISPFFANLASAYQAELDDLAFDSEGSNVLRHRLAEKRKELAFLRQMIELSPEMVAVVFHQGFQFHSAAAMEHLVSRDSDELPAWHSLTSVVGLQPWAKDVAMEIQKSPMGGWLMAVAAGLEYLYHRPGTSAAAQPGALDHDDENNDVNDEDARDLHDPRLDDDQSADDDGDDNEAHRRRDEAGEDWMEAQGFDRKGH